jgi:aryl-alcohol dehydrogenase
MKVSAAIAREQSKPFTIEEVEMDDPKNDEILVRIVGSGICQTDAHVWHQRLAAPLPAILGHEGSGVVEKVGSSVKTVKPGDHVVISYQACGHCSRCLSGHYSYCDNALQANFSGARLDGTNGVHFVNDNEGTLHGHFFGQSSFATYALATERNTVVVPKDAPLEILGALGCGLQTGAGAILKSFKVPAGSAVAVFGTGAVGMAAIMAAKISGASIIIAVDVNKDRLDMAVELGATHTIDPSQSDTSKRIHEITGDGADFILDTSGRKEMLQHAVSALGSMGQVGLVASGGSDATVAVAPLTLGNAIRGIVQGDAVPQLFIPELIGYFKAGHFPFDKLVKIYDFKEINQAFEDSAKGIVIKPILRISQQ